MSLKTIVSVVLFCFVVFVHSNVVLRQPGKFIIGQVLPFHKTTSNTSQCGELDLEKIIEVEALVYSVNKIKETNQGLDIGYDIIDACAEPQMLTAMDMWFQEGGNMSDVAVAIITDFNKERDVRSEVRKARL